tara:strand:+ start:1332 stop:1943 length:612 start_codon:yes stop_codon:yes gene_type:complete
MKGLARTQQALDETELELLFLSLLQRTLLHDVRGAISTVSGWVELASMDGKPVPAGLERGVDHLRELVITASSYHSSPKLDTISAGKLLSGIPRAESAPENMTIKTPFRALRAVLRSLGADTIRFTAAGESKASLELSGLPEQGVQLAMRPMLELLQELRRSNEWSATLCTALLRPLATSSNADLLSLNSSSLSLTFSMEDSL